MAKEINKFSAVMYLSKDEQYLQICPEKVYHPLCITHPFNVPIKSEIVPTEKNNFKTNHFLDYLEAESPEEDIKEIYRNHPAQKQILSTIEHAVSLIAEIIAEKGIEKTLIKIQIASSNEKEKCGIKRMGNPNTHKGSNHTSFKPLEIQ